MESFIKDKVALITGASGGIGYELTKSFARYGASKLILISRNKEKLQNLKDEITLQFQKIDVFIYEIDISNLENLQNELFKMRIDHPIIDILINNAGLLVNKSYSEQSINEAKAQFETNYFAPSLIVKELLPSLLSSLDARIVNISSMGGYQGSSKYAGLSHYSASKGALSILTECLAEELKHTNISINALALGAVETEMLQNAFPNFIAPISAIEMANFISNLLNVNKMCFSGKILPLALNNP